MEKVTALPIITNNATPSFTNVYLSSWWLIKTQIDVNGKKLAVGGFKYVGSKDPQVFSSAPIVKKYDFSTLQTADGVAVYIEGSINKIRSLNNGISSEVCNRFRFGFPYDWDDSRYHCGEDSMSTSTSCQSNDRDNQKEGGTDENLFRKKFKDASNNTVLQADAECLGQFDVELQKTEDALAKNSVGRAEIVSSTSRGRKNGIKKSLGPFEARRSSRLRNTKKGTDDGQDSKTNKSTLVSLVSDLVTENEIHCEPGVEDVRGSPFIRPHEKSNYLDDVNLTGMKGNSRHKTKRRLDYITEVCTPPISRSKRKKLSLLSPEESSCKKSGSGRLTVPPLDYWRNQQVFYDLNRRVAGVLNGLPLAESCTGSFSEPSRKLKKFL